MSRPLAPAEMYPARAHGVATRYMQLDTGVRVRVAEAGPESGTPLLCIHGWGASLYMFRHALEMLGPLGFRVVALDLRGAGLSDKPRTRGAYTAEAFRADLASLIERLGYTRVVVMGQSMGGGIALDFALARPERVSALVLINPTGLTPVPFIVPLRVAPGPFVRIAGRRMVPRWLVRQVLRRLAYGNPGLVSEATVDEYWAPTQIAGHVAGARAQLSEMRWAPLSADVLRSLAVPTLLIRGRRDRLVRIPEAATRAPWIQQVHTMDGGHCAHEEAPEEAMSVVEQFIRAARV
jgi:pimeloyl-ACP methyl ester carboxylesterase